MLSFTEFAIYFMLNYIGGAIILAIISVSTREKGCDYTDLDRIILNNDILISISLIVFWPFTLIYYLFLKKM